MRWVGGVKDSLCRWALKKEKRFCFCYKTYHASQAKVWNALFLNGGDEDGVEVAPRVISQAEQDLHTRSVMLHV